MLNFLATTCANNSDLKNIIAFIKIIYTIFEIAIPILLILFGTIDLGKAVMAGEEKEIKAATEMLLKRAIAAIAVFLLVIVVRLVTGIVAGPNSEWTKCWNDKTPYKPEVTSQLAPIVEKVNI
jgi:hypothetical protein